MPLCNPLLMVHKGLKALLFDTAKQLQQVDFTDSEESASMIERISFVMGIFERHVQNRERQILPVVVPQQPSVMAYFPVGVGASLSALYNLRTALKKYKASFGSANIQSIAVELNTAFLQFLSFHLQQMELEEQVIGPALQLHQTDENLRSLTLILLQQLSANNEQQLYRWIVEGLNDGELTAWLKCMKQSAPYELFETGLAIAEKHLPSHRWQALQEALQEGILIAEK